MNDVLKREKEIYSSEPSAHVSVDTNDIEKYIDKMENSYHKKRREEWWKAYKINYRNRHKDQIIKRKSELD